MKPGPVFDFTAQMREAVAPTSGFSALAVENFWEFIKEAGFNVDRRLILPDPFYWLHPLYRITRTDLLGRKNAAGEWIIRPKFEVGLMMRKASQMGASVFSMLFMIWLCIDLERPLSIACFWPTEDDLQDFVRSRFKKMIESSPRMEPYLGGKLYNTRTIEIGNSIIYLRYVKGNASLDSIPVDVVIADEIRLYDDAQKILERADFRMAQSKVKLRIYFSTVGSPGDFMETRWDKSNKMKFFSECPHCDAHTEVMNSDNERDRLHRGDALPEAPEGLLLRGVVMSDQLPPDVIRRGERTELVRRGADSEPREELVDDTHYRCPCCGGRLDDLSAGQYRETHPGPGRWWALEFSALLSRETSPLEIINKWDDSKDRKEFFNNILAKPYIDPEGILIKPGAVEKSRNPHLSWHRVAPRGIVTTLGADFRTEEIHVVVRGSEGPGERGQILHLEVIQGRDEPMKRLQELLVDFRVSRAVIDYRPHTTATLALAQEHDLTVFLAQYVPGEIVRLKSEGGNGTAQVSEDVREKNMVLLDRTKMLKYAAMLFSSGYSELPSEPLMQANFYDRHRKLHDSWDLAEEFLLHLQNLALSHKPATTKNASGETKQKAGELIEEIVNVKFDPHFFHAYSYAVAAEYLTGGEARLVRPDPASPRLLPDAVSGSLAAERARTSLSDSSLSTFLGTLRREVERTRRCGLCVHFGGKNAPGQLGKCAPLGVTTQADAPACRHRGLYRDKSH